MSVPQQITQDIQALRAALLLLPPIGQFSGPPYPFEDFVVDQDYVEYTGSIQGSINHTLEIEFGSRVDGKPIQFRHHGPDLVAVADVLAAAITGYEGENPILLKWVADIHAAAKHAYMLSQSINVDALPDQEIKRTRKDTVKRALMVQEEQEKAAEKKQKVLAKEQSERMRARTEEKIRYDPNDIRDVVVVPTTGAGRNSNELLDKVTIACELISNPSQKLWRCSAEGCVHTRAYPRSSARVLPHTMFCQHFPPEIREQAAVACKSQSLTARMNDLDLMVARNGKSGQGAQPSVKEAAQREGQERRSLKHNHLALLLVCGRSLPPTMVDSEYWKDMVYHLDPRIRSYSGSHMANALIPAEAAHVRDLSIRVLRARRNLTLSFDGATTRANDSVYTVHVTTPDTRESHLIAGDEATGKSHTGEHLKSMLLRSIEAIGIERFSAIVSDNAGNTRLARELLEEEYCWLIHLADPCHQMNNTAKDIGALEYFGDANSKLRAVIKYFRKSSYGAHHLKSWQHILRITKGLVPIGKTRFLTFYYAINHLLPCINIITDLVRSKVIKNVTRTHPLHFLYDIPATRAFTDRLEQERAFLEPLARSVKILESSASTPADVILCWLACQATLNDIFTQEDKRNLLMLTEDIISEVRGIVNARFSEMIEGPDRQVYLSTLFLDPHYLGSALFTRKTINPLSTTVYISTNRSSAATISNTDSRRLPDADLRASFPAYVSSGAYLGRLLVNEINAGRLPQEIISSYKSAEAIIEEFRIEFENYTRQKSPFDRYMDSKTSFEYWERVSRHFDAQLLSFLALKLYSIVPNSMAEERTVSNFTKLNSSDRGRQKASTLVFMTQIKQHELRQRKAPGSERPPNPIIRFRDLSDIVKGHGKPEIQEAASEHGSDKMQAPTVVTAVQPMEGMAELSKVLEELEVDSWEKEAGLDEAIKQLDPGARDRFEIVESDGVNLEEPLLLDLLSDEPVAGVVARGGHGLSSTDNMPVASGSSPASFVAQPFQF